MSQSTLPSTLAKPTTKESGCPCCGQDIVFSAYFDRFGFAKEHSDSLSNIGKLFDLLSYRNGQDITKLIPALRTTKHYKRYVSGLGAPYKPQHPLKTSAVLVLDSVPGTAKGAVEDKAKDMGKEAAKGETLRKGVSDVLKKETGMSALGWKKNWEDFFHHRSVASATSGVSAKQVATSARLAKKHVMDGVQGAAKLGKSVAKGVAKEVVKAGALAALDGTEAADTDFIARAFRSGYKKRINEAWDALATIIKAEKDNIKPPSQTCCGEVRVFIFGAEWGGTLARIFANKIVKECKRKDGKLTYEDILVKISFVGLFDCANSVSTKKGINSLLGFTPFTVSLDDTALPPEVEAAVHLYAAHERGYLLSSIAGGRAAVQEECALPGISADVCGGNLLKGEYGLAHLDIAKYALCQMHAVARGFGAPLARPDDGTDQAKALEVALSTTFSINGRDVYDLLPQYLHITDTATAEPERAICCSAEAYVKWLRMLYDEANEGHELDTALATTDGISKAYIEAMKKQVRHAAPEARRGVQLVASAREHQIGKIWLTGEHQEDPLVRAFFAAYVHFNYPTLPLSFREVGE